MTGDGHEDHGLHVVPDPDPDVPGEAAGVNDPALDLTLDPALAETVETGDPLLARAQRIAELPLDERPAAFDGLNRALVAELQTLEEG